MKLADLVDLELQLDNDRLLDEATLQKRDRRIGRVISGQGTSVAERHRFFLEWLRSIRKDRGSSPGEHLQRGYRLVSWALIGLGLILGVSTTRVVLAYDGSVPVNVIHVLAVFVFFQLALLALLGLSSVIRIVLKPLSPGPIYRVLRYVGVRWSRVGDVLPSWIPSKGKSVDVALGRLKAHEAVYGNVERWFLIRLSQVFGVTFNVAALLTFLYLVTFSDLAFGWSTTLELSAQQFQDMVSVLSEPWVWALESARPTVELIEESRFFRLEGWSGQLHDAAFIGGWWPFLLMALLVYGLLPRMGLLVLSEVRIRRMLATIPLDHGEFQALFERLTGPRITTWSDSKRGTTAKDNSESVQPAECLEISSACSECTVVVWGDPDISEEQVKYHVLRRFNWSLIQTLEAGHGPQRNDEQTCTLLAEESKNASHPIVVVAESFEAPTKEVVEFFRQVRVAVGHNRHCVVALVNRNQQGGLVQPAADDFALWQTRLRTLGDPYLRVVNLVENP